MTKLTRSEAGSLGQIAGQQTRNNQKRQRVLQYNIRPTLCKYCNSPLSYKDNIRKKKFCNSSCSAIYHNTRKIGKWENQRCNYCGEVILGARLARTYCSSKCQGLHKTKTHIDKWLAGEISGLVNGVIDGITTRAIRLYLINLAGHRCSSCGWGKVHSITRVVPLEIDHIDGDHNNNRPENMRVLCPNCHSLTPTYRSLNFGHGRKGRIGAGGRGRTHDI